MKATIFRTCIVLTIATFVTGGLLVAGPLNPPAGPVAGTYKTLTEVEPRTAINAANTPGDSDSLFKIAQPGSYYLTGNIIASVGKHGIKIVSSGVTLDLNGFDLQGVPSMGAFDGISVTAAGLTNISILNGSIRNFGGDGIDMISNGAANCRIEGVECSANAGNGLSVGVGSEVVHCVVRSNTQHGMFVSGGSTITNCSVTLNSGNGINSGSACTISDCTVYQNSTGISTSSGCTISNCTVQENHGHGISTNNGCLIEGCGVRLNMFDGIQCGSNCFIRDNMCDSNGNGGDGAGIHVIGAENRISGNNCTAADRGIDVDGTRNIIVKNTCSGNTTNWDVVASNVILVINATSTTAAVTGNSGGTSPGSTDPNANFTY